ncbi:MAG TPA: nicotinate-nucleotide adenylyltransferase, partial [Blastocatellia bacterium]|nr:nicotinate-nucleotide adenylyltransferase [Blastocatellia bacterium]
GEATILDKRRIGAYGGTFDPPHTGHLEVARAVFRSFALDELLLIPAYRPPHKRNSIISNSYHRYAMTVLATIEEAGLKVSTLEIDAPERPFTFETVERLKEIYGDRASLYFVMGADSFEEINTWREPARLLAATNLVVAARPGHEISTSHVAGRFAPKVVDLRGQTEAPSEDGCCHIYLTDYVQKDVSSTEIRRRVAEGEPVDGLVPEAVADYIKRYELYRR